MRGRRAGGSEDERERSICVDVLHGSDIGGGEPRQDGVRLVHGCFQTSAGVVESPDRNVRDLRGEGRVYVHNWLVGAEAEEAEGDDLVGAAVAG